MAARLNPSRGGKPDKIIKHALMLELHREAEDDSGHTTTRLSLLARRLVSMAIGGDLGAILAIADRIDGRVATPLPEPAENGAIVISWLKESEPSSAFISPDALADGRGQLVRISGP